MKVCYKVVAKQSWVFRVYVECHQKVGNLDTLCGESSNLIPPKVEPLNTPHAKYAHYTLLYTSNSLSIPLCEKYPTSLTNTCAFGCEENTVFDSFHIAHAHCCSFNGQRAIPHKVHETRNFLLMSHTNASKFDAGFFFNKKIQFKN